MINRILIRVKVVQMLYSYLLTRSEFRIDAAPESASRDRRFAYTVYINLLMLIMELSGSHPRLRTPGVVIPPKLGNNRVGKALADTDKLKAAVLKNHPGYLELRACVPALLEAIEKSAAFTDYSRKRKSDLDIDVRLWTTILQTIIGKSEAVENALRKSDEFTAAGFEAGLRQAVATLEAYNDSRATYRNAINNLEVSLSQAYDLYHFMFALMIELTDAQAQRIENAKRKYLATAADLNPDTRFIDNAFINRLRESEALQKYLKDHPIRWSDEPALIKSLLDSILSSEVYADYMAAPATSYEADCNLWRNLLKYVILPSDSLAEELENRSIYWNDDLEIMATFAIKTINHFAKAPDAEVAFLPKFKDDEDARFGAELFRYAVENREQYRGYIDKFVKSDQWDPERIAFMDIVIMICAIAELIHYPAIPVPVTLNEYIEIANHYSSSRSGQFINGLLYSIVNYLKDEGVLKK